MKVLLFSNDLMPFGNLPTSGGGLRCYQLMQGLMAHGIEVIASMPGFTYLAEKHAAEIPEQQREYLWRWETQDSILRRVRPDAVLFASNWDHYNLSKKPDVPLIIDLHGSRLIETTMWGHPANTDRKISNLGQADCLTCAGEKQRTYFNGWLVQAGRVPEREHFIRYIPISLSPNVPERLPIDSATQPLFVSGGGWFPWQNQSKAIFTVCDEIVRRNRGQIRIFGTPHETNHLSPEERVIRGVYRKVCELAETSPRIKVGGYIGREELIEIYRSASVAVEAMEYNLERELAFTTRTIEYLWCGLPVLYNNYSEISGHLRDYDAGWAIDPSDVGQLQAVVSEVFEHPEKVQQKSMNAQRLVRDRFSWDKTILPLVDFLKSPQQAKNVEPALGAVWSCPSYLSPRGATVEIPLTASLIIRQDFVLPAENIGRVEIPYSIKNNGREIDSEAQVQFALIRGEGESRFQQTVHVSDLAEVGKLSIRFPALRRPPGGTKFRLEIRQLSRSAQEKPANVFLRGMINPGFPYLGSEQQKFSGMSLGGDPVEARAIAISFVPAGGRVYQLKLLAERACGMIRRGEWSRLLRAAMKRSPRAVQRLRELVTSQ